MTRFIDLPSMSRLVRSVGAARFIGELADALHEDFLRWPEFDKSARVASHSERGVIELMPVADARRHAFKYVNGHPSNTSRGLCTVMAFGALADVDTGYPLLLSELTLATALRTAATSLMAARALARPGARRMALIGNGAQSEFQALAFHAHLGIEEIAVFDLDPAASDKLARNLRLVDALRPVAERHGVSVPAAAVAWTLAWPGVSGAIVGARNASQVDGWIAAASLRLDNDDMTAIATAIETSGAGTGPARPAGA